MITTASFAQDLDKNIEDRLNEFFKSYSSSAVNMGRSSLDSFEVDHNKKELIIHANKRFAFQPFRETTVQTIYRTIKQSLPGPVNYYDIKILVEGTSIEDLVPNFYRSKKLDSSRLTGAIEDKETPWVTNTSQPYTISRGLADIHLSLWQSHGRYFVNKKNQWMWQRPYLFCTTEDLFTQSFVTPFLIPMLENAGAIVFTPRERDIQKNEVIVDNDTPRGSIYIQEDKKKQRWQNKLSTGFAHPKNSYQSGENPFTMGTSSFVATKSKKAKSFAQWVPTIPESGRYAVYVTYQTFPNSVDDAQYLVFHNGGITEFKVNQKIGGGTWTYLGTFDFSKGNSPRNMVVLTNHSKTNNGIVSADAIRFGGGMGNIERGGQISGYPRYLEGARYSTQWYGMDESIYTNKSRDNDYADDMNARSNTINYLSGGSKVNPQKEGLKVPIQLNIALHSDAGYNVNDKIIGTLGIHTKTANDTSLGSGKNRLSSRDLVDIIQTDLQKEIQSNFDIQWTRRSIWDSNYSETRLPDVPSVIIELLSHQNFKDMQLGHDPYFKFIVSRSIYKSILKYLSNQTKKDYVVQPLPVHNFSIDLKGSKAYLSWEATRDITDESATPREYIVYTKLGNGGFDNGTIVSRTNTTIDLKPNVRYSFKVCALNQGGKSFPSEVLTVFKAPKESKRILIVNGFTRLSGPYVINNQFEAGFDLNEDPGVPYMYDISLAGIQQNFRRADAKIQNGYGLGYSLNNLEGLTAKGNTFDFTETHGEAMMALPNISFTSASIKSIEDGKIDLNDYDAVDFIFGLQTKANYNPTNNRHFELFNDNLQRIVSNYTLRGGNLLVSGSYLGSNLAQSEQEKSFMNNTLKCNFEGSITDRSIDKVSGLNQQVAIPRYLNEIIYIVNKPEIINPTNGSFSTMIYDQINQSAAIAYTGNYKTFVLGFPFETITSKKGRAAIMSSILYFLLYNNK